MLSVSSQGKNCLELTEKYTDAKIYFRRDLKSKQLLNQGTVNVNAVYFYSPVQILKSVASGTEFVKGRVSGIVHGIQNLDTELETELEPDK